MSFRDLVCSSSFLLLFVSMLPACDRASTEGESPAPKSPEPGDAAKAPAGDTKTAAATPGADAGQPADATKPPADSAAADAPAGVASCAELAAHVHDVLMKTGSTRTKENLPPAEKSRAECEKRPQDPELVRCFMAARDEAAIDACNLEPFEGKPIDGTPKRRFDAIADNSAADPPVMTEDGDYLAWDEECGLLFKSVPPAGAVFVACDGKVQIGPIVNIDVLDEVMKSISDAERSRHEMVMGIIGNMPSGDFTTPVRVYDAQGRYKGIEYR